MHRSAAAQGVLSHLNCLGCCQCNMCQSVALLAAECSLRLTVGVAAVSHFTLADLQRRLQTKIYARYKNFREAFLSVDVDRCSSAVCSGVG